MDHINSIETNESSEIKSPIICNHHLSRRPITSLQLYKDDDKNIANIVYELSQFYVQNIFILENKKNIIMDGKFTKIIYSDNFFVCHGIFLLVDLFLDGIIDNNIKPLKNSNIPFEFVDGQISPIFCNNSLKKHPITNLQQYKHENCEKQYTRILTRDRDKDFRDFDNNCKGHFNNGGSKFFVKLQPKIEFNEKTVNRLINIEHSILEFYKNIYHCTKRSMPILKNQLLNGLIKIHQKNEIIYSMNFSLPKRFVLKISGIWEDSDSIGLTYRFIYDYTVESVKLPTKSTTND